MVKRIIEVASNLDGFFASEIQSAANKQGVEASPYACKYLASVLAKFASSKNYLVENPVELDKNKQSFPTLALLLLEGMQTPPAEQYFKLQHVGDVALFTTGFFAERLDRKMIDMDYYLAMGEQAYQRAGRLQEQLVQEKAINVFFELASSFGQFVEVFAEVADQSLLMSDKEILKLYEKWLKTGNHRIQRMLGEAGVITGSINHGSGGHHES